ncbi:MAG: proprotein convertase P-domain-containing protein [Planctomycetota bacterium]
MKRRLVAACVGLALAWSSTAYAQYFVDPVLVDGDMNVDNLGVVDNVDKVNVAPTGVVAFGGDDDGTATGEEFIYSGGSILIRDGAVIVGSGTTLLTIDAFIGYRQVSSAGDVVYTGNLEGGDALLAVNDTQILRDLQNADGIAARVYNDFFEPALTDAGTIYVEVDLDGATTDDEVIYVVTGGMASPLAMNGAGSLFREGTLIVGGPLDGETWDLTAFTNSTANNLGTFITDGNLDDVGATTAVNDDVLIRKQVGMDYELLLRGGDLLATPLSGMAPFESITDITIADANNDWAIYGIMDDLVTTLANDNVAVASIGGSAPMVIAQEGEDISALTGITGTTIGTLSAAVVNSNGKVLIQALVNDDGINIPPYDEALFIWEAGALSLILTDEVPIPALAGTTITDIVGTDVVINDQDRVFFQGTTSNAAADGIFEAVLPLVFPVENLSCALSVGGTEVVATWGIPAGQVYDGIRVFENGALVATLGGAATTHTSATPTVSSSITITVVPFVGVDDAPLSNCSGVVVLAPNFTECSTPTPPPAVDSLLPPVVDVLPVVANVALRDLTVLVQITHTFQGDLDMSLSSPSGTIVELATDIGGTLDNVDTLFADFGIPLQAATDLSLGNIHAPEGPGSMADFRCELSGGNWSLTVDDDAGGDTGTLDMWCLNIYEDPTPALNCCDEPTGLVCSNVGACGGPAVNLSWTNNAVYDLLELRRLSAGGATTIALGAAATSFTDNTVVDGESYTYELRYRCAPGGLIQVAASCSVSVNLTTVPAVSNLVCTPDPCGTSDVSLSWVNGATYSSLTLNRAGVFLANVTGLASFVDMTAPSGSVTYSLIADCGGNTSQTNCVVDNTPPPVTNLVCAGDFCANEANLTWNTNGVPYTSITLNRAGVFLADVTGQSSFTDSAPLAGTTSYSVIVDCAGLQAQTNCVVNLNFQGPSGLTCVVDSVLCNGVVNVSWTNNSSYSSLDLVVDGLTVVPGPGPMDTSATIGPLASGSHTIDLVSSCPGDTATISCTVVVTTPPAGETDCILALEGVQSAVFGDVGTVNSGAALAAALVANGRSVYVTAPAILNGSILTDLPCGVDLSTFETIWILTGTFPDDYRITAAEGDFLAGLGALGIGLYFEASDHWGFVHVNSLLDERDGIEPDTGTNIVDGDDTFTQMDGANAPIAMLDLSGNVDVTYDQDQTGTDFTDELTTTGTTAGAAPDAMITSAEAIWLNSPDGLPVGDVDDADAYITGVIALHMDGGRMISTSWEFGGYGGDQTLLAGAYLAALGRSTVPMEQFIRGNCNGLDGGVNIADAVYLLGNLFPGGGTPNVLNCRDACDANDDGNINIADAVALLGSLFGNPAIPLPAPNAMNGCGPDPTPGDPLECAINPPTC